LKESGNATFADKLDSWRASSRLPPELKYRSAFLCLYLFFATQPAVIIPVGKKGNEGTESRVEIRSATGETLGWKSVASYDGEHGIGVNHAEWTADGQFFVFNVASSAGHQPWRRATYFYSRDENRFHSLDDYIGPVTSDFTIEERNVVKTTRFNFGSCIKNDDGQRLNDARRV
jgi:hypothetical protein